MKILASTQNYQPKKTNVNFGIELRLSPRVIATLYESEKLKQVQQLERLKSKLLPLEMMPNGKSPIFSVLSDDESEGRQQWRQFEDNGISGYYLPYPKGISKATGIKTGKEFLENPIECILRLLSSASYSSADSSARSMKIEQRIDCDIFCYTIPFEDGLNIEYHTFKPKT